MTNEEKQFLLTDVCARLPYVVKVKSSRRREPVTLSLDAMTDFYLGCSVKPYLRPMLSMTEEEKENYCNLQDKFLCSSQYPVTDAYVLFDWLNSHHFDYRGLIEKGLALEAPEGMYN